MSDEQLSLTAEAPAAAPTLPPLNAEIEAPAKTSTPAPEAPSTSIRDSLKAGLGKLAERSRDDAGRFTPGQKPNGHDTTQPQLQTPAPNPPKVERPANMPKAWGADKAALWSAMTPEQQAYVTDRETQAEQLHNNYSGLKKWHETALENGTTLPEVLDRMHAVETKMYESPPDGIIAAMQAVGLDHNSAVKTLVGALQRLGVNLNGVTATQGQPQGQQQPQQQFRDPRVDQMLAERNQEKLRQATETVAKFRTDPANKHFEEVADDIMREIAFERSQGREPDLAKIYERVTWANPGTRQKILADQAAKAAEAQAQVKSQELAKARSASGSVAGTIPAAEGRKPEKPASLRDDLTQKVRALMSGRV